VIWAQERRRRYHRADSRSPPETRTHGGQPQHPIGHHPIGHPGDAGRGGPGRHRLSLRAALASERLSRRRHLLRDLGLRDHRVAVPNSRAARFGLFSALFRAPGAPAAARAHHVRRGHRARGAALHHAGVEPVHDFLANRDRRSLRRVQSLSLPPVDGLLRRLVRVQSLHADLVAGRRGTVLSRVPVHRVVLRNRAQRRSDGRPVSSSAPTRRRASCWSPRASGSWARAP
jgi:hypothetical protein